MYPTALSWSVACSGESQSHARAVQAVMEGVEGGRRWGACQEAVQPADELKAACDAADGWLKVAPLCQLCWAHVNCQYSAGLCGRQ